MRTTLEFKFNNVKSKTITSNSQNNLKYSFTPAQVPKLKPKKNNNPIPPMSLYSKSLKNTQQNKFILEKINFLKDDIKLIEYDHKDIYLSCPEKGELENSFSTDETDICTTLNTRKNDTPFSINKSLKRLLNINECEIKEYSLECEDISPSAFEILGRNKFLDYLSPKNYLSSPSKKSFSPKKKFASPRKSLFSSKENEKFKYATENLNESQISILGRLELKSNLSIENI